MAVRDPGQVVGLRLGVAALGAVDLVQVGVSMPGFVGCAVRKRDVKRPLQRRCPVFPERQRRPCLQVERVGLQAERAELDREGLRLPG